MSLSTIHVDGIDFKDDQNKVWRYVGMTASALFKRWLEPNGPRVVVEPNLQQWRQMANEGGYDGEITLRVFRFAAPPNAFALDPWSYPMGEVTNFTNYCNERRFRIDWTCGDAQIVLPDPHGPKGQQQHLNEFCNALVPVAATNFVQTCNEPFKNGIDVRGIVPPPSRMVDPKSPWGTYLRDSGMYYGGQWDTSIDLDFISLHTDRGMEGRVVKWLGKIFESAVFLWDIGKPPVQNEPMGFDEVDRPGSRSNNPRYAGLLGMGVAFTGIGFHSSAGQPCDQFGPVTRLCAVSFFRGVKAGLGV